MNRREFLGVTLGAGLSSKAFALPGDKFRWAINTHMFTPLKPYPEAGIKIAARFGLHGIEPWANELQN